mgnify:CR=1 FL=1
MSDYQKYYNEDEAYFRYVEEISDETYQQIIDGARSAISVFGIPETNDGRELAEYINKIVENILETGEYPKEYYDNDELKFDYKIKEGRCTTRNAMAILKMAGLVQNQQKKL